MSFWHALCAIAITAVFTQRKSTVWPLASIFCSKGLLTHLLSCDTTIASSSDSGSCTCKRLRLGAGTCDEVVQSSLPLTVPCRPLFRPISGAEDT